MTGRVVTEESAAQRMQLGLELKKARTDAELTQSDVADKLGCTQGKVQKIETTLVSISAADLDMMLTLYQVPEDEAAKLRALAGPDRRGRPSRTGLSTAWSAFGQNTPGGGISRPGDYI